MGDIIITGDFDEELCGLRKYLAHEFDIKELGNLRYFLGMEVARSRDEIASTQRQYTLDLLKETGMLGCKPSGTPMDFNKKIGPVEDRLIHLSHT